MPQPIPQRQFVITFALLGKLQDCRVSDQISRWVRRVFTMQQQTDDQVTLKMVAQARKRFPLLNACSFDKGFHSPTNQIALKKQLELVVLPRKGKLSKQAQAEEQAAPFVKARRAHSAVESAINGLEVHGLDVCRDHGIEGFKRYVALAVVARNIHRIGAIVWQREIEREQRESRYADHGTTYKLAA